MRESPRLASSHLGSVGLLDEQRHDRGGAGGEVVRRRRRAASASYVGDAGLRLQQGLGDDLGPAGRVVAGVGEPAELLDDDPARDVAAVVAAHAVGDDEDRRGDEEGVLVDLAHPADVGGGAVVQLDAAHPTRPADRAHYRWRG